MKNEIETYDKSDATKNDLFKQLITDAYDGDSSRILQIVQFIKENAYKGSALAYYAYKTLLDDMDKSGQLYMNEVVFDNGLGGGLHHYTYRALTAIEAADGIGSQVFTQDLPRVVTTLLKGKEVFIQNSATKGYLYALNDSAVRLSDDQVNDNRYSWVLSPSLGQWTEKNRELFYIKNLVDNRILAVGDGSLELAEPTDEKLKSTWAMFYIRLIEGATGQEVAIQCSYWGIKTLGLNDAKSKPELLNLESVKDAPESVWYLKPKPE